MLPLVLVPTQRNPCKPEGQSCPPTEGAAGDTQTDLWNIFADLTIYRRQTNRNRSKRGRQLLSGATLHHITLADPRQGGARDAHPLVRGPISFILMQF